MSNQFTSRYVVRVSSSNPDPAIDPTKSDFAGYIRTRNIEHLAFKADTTPTMFQIERLPHGFLVDVLDGVFPLAARRTLAFRAAVHAVFQGMPSGDESAIYRDKRNQLLRVYPKAQAPRGASFPGIDGDHGVLLAPDSFVQAICDEFGAEPVQELGQVAIHSARLPEGSDGPFGLWLGSVASD